MVDPQQAIPDAGSQDEAGGAAKRAWNDETNVEEHEGAHAKKKHRED